MSLISKGLVGDYVESDTSLSTDGYQRPSDWLTMPTLTDADEKIVMLAAVYDSGSNFVAVECTGDYTIDWGDGSTHENIASGVKAERNINYADLSPDTLCSRGYRQTIITIKPQTVGGLITANLAEQHSVTTSGYASQIIECTISAPNITTINFKSSGSVFSAMLESFTLNSNALTSASNMFYLCYGLINVLFKKQLGSGKISTAGMFHSCRSLKKIDLSLLVSSNLYNMFHSCSSLLKIPDIKTESLADSRYMTRDCGALVEIGEIDVSSVSAAYILSTIIFNNMSIASSKIIGAKFGHSYENSNLSANSINAIFENLQTITTEEIITITGNWGADTCDTTIATTKGWTVVN